jgi:hypothetical protein
MKIWFDTELRVAPEDLARPGHGVFNPHARRLRLDPQLKIFRLIVQFAAIYVVYVFAWQQFSTKFDLDHMPVLVDPPTVWRPDTAITRVSDVFALHAADTATLAGRTSAGRSRRVSAVAARSLVVDEAKPLNSGDGLTVSRGAFWRVGSLPIDRPFVGIAPLTEG